MSEVTEKTWTDLVLPVSVVTKLDLARLVSDLERVDSDLTSAAVRDKVGGVSDFELSLTPQLEAFLGLNQLDIHDSTGRSHLIRQLRVLQVKAPAVHMTFSTPVDSESLAEVAKWLRESVHAQAVIDVGLQPALVAGVYLRTPNKVYDLSLREQLRGSRGALIEQLEALRAEG